MAALNPFLQANKNYANDIYKKVMVRVERLASSLLVSCRVQKADKKGYDAARYRRRVPVKVYESLFAFACDAKLLTPDQVRIPVEAVLFRTDTRPSASLLRSGLPARSNRQPRLSARCSTARRHLRRSSPRRLRSTRRAPRPPRTCRLLAPTRTRCITRCIPRNARLSSG